MKDTERLIDALHDLPPALEDPQDRFEQVQRRVHRTRRRQTVAAGVGGVAALALAVPVAAQLLPETAELGPAGGISATTDSPAARTLDPRPGGVVLTLLSEPRTVTGSGTVTVALGDRPTGATTVNVDLRCIDAGRFWVPDGSGPECTERGAALSVKNLAEESDSGFQVELTPGQDEIVIDATGDARWQVTTTYVGTGVIDWGVNANGQTFGLPNETGEPDLIAVTATNGQSGYAYVAEMNAADGPEPTSPEEAVRRQEERAGQTFSVTVYESDGETVVGEFVIGGSNASDVTGTTDLP